MPVVLSLVLILIGWTNRSDLNRSGSIQRIYRLMIWTMWYLAGWLKRRECFIRWSWKGWKVKERLSNRMTTQDKFVTAIMIRWWGFGGAGFAGGVFILRCLNADLQIVVPSIWWQCIQTFVSSGMGKISHEVGVTFKAEPSFSRKYPVFFLHPVLRFFLAVAPSPVLRTVLSYSGMAYHWILIISLYEQCGHFSI